MNTEYSALVPFEIDRAAPMCQNYTYDVQTQVDSVFGGVLAADREVSSNHCPDEKGTESYRRLPATARRGGSNHCPDEKGTES